MSMGIIDAVKDQGRMAIIQSLIERCLFVLLIRGAKITKKSHSALLYRLKVNCGLCL